MSSTDSIVLDQFSSRLIRRIAWRLTRYAGLSKRDREDLEQELTVRLQESLANFDPAQAHRNVFITTVVERNARKIIRDRLTQKRSNCRVGSLDAMLEDGEDGLPELARESHDLEHADAAIDVAELIARLPADLRDIAERLKTQSISQAAREMGIPRTTLRRRLEKLRRHFSAAGYGDFA